MKEESMFNSGARLCLYLLIVIAGIRCGGIARAADPLIFAVHPYLPATELIERFTPLIQYLSRELRVPVNLVISRDYKSHIVQVGKNRADIAYMGPASYVEMVEQFGKKPLLARLEIIGKPTFQGIIIVRADSPLLTLRDLIGKRFAFGDPDSTMSHLVPRYVLWKNGVTTENLGGYAFLNNHHNVALGVLAGDYDAGAVKDEVFYSYEHRGLRELMRTWPLSEHVFTANTSLSPETLQKLRNALYSLRDKEGGQDIMASLKHSITGMVPVEDGDYDSLRHILQKLAEMRVTHD